MSAGKNILLLAVLVVAAYIAYKYRTQIAGELQTIPGTLAALLPSGDALTTAIGIVTTPAVVKVPYTGQDRLSWQSDPSNMSFYTQPDPAKYTVSQAMADQMNSWNTALWARAWGPGTPNYEVNPSNWENRANTLQMLVATV
jgi:hypothetical protein